MAVVRCAACGTENPAGSEYCRTCARKLDAATQETVTRQRAVALESQTTAICWTTILIAVIAVVVIAAIVVGLLATGTIGLIVPAGLAAIPPAAVFPAAG